jgi:Tol biopolymer transport system component
MQAPSASALGAGGAKGSFNSGHPSISSDARYIAFNSGSPNLTPEQQGGCSCVYVRDTQTGVTSLASVNPSGGTSDGGLPVISGDGRYVAFEGQGPNFNTPVWRRDMQGVTTAVVSRATGPLGAIANDSSGEPSISADGRFVAFHSIATNLSPDDTTSEYDVYVRDLQLNTTVLVSRASGASGAKAANPSGPLFSADPSISANGRYVAFLSSATNLDPAATDGLAHVYVRDLQTNTTTLADRVSGPAGTDANGNARYPSISGDGSSVTFTSQATNLSVDDTDTTEDVYVRNLQTNTTTLVDRASGPLGAKANNWAITPALSDDGHLVVFSSAGSNLDPADTDSTFDVFLRDLNTSQTTLVSRATGPSGADANSDAYELASITPDGRYVSFQSYANNLHHDDADQILDVFVRDLTGQATYLESRATVGWTLYARPRGATPFRVSLVPAFQACAAPNTSHGSPLAFPSCGPPSPNSPNLTVGVGDGSPALARSIGSLRLDAMPDSDPDDPADDSDIRIRFGLTNVMRKSDLSDYTGELQARTSVRMTDKLTNDGYTLNGNGTVSDFDFALTVPCVATASTLDGGSCTAVTTARAVLPGFVSHELRRIYELGQVRVYDGGPDEDADTTGDNSLFAVQGVFVP